MAVTITSIVYNDKFDPDIYHNPEIIDAKLQFDREKALNEKDIQRYRELNDELNVKYSEKCLQICEKRYFDRVFQAQNKMYTRKYLKRKMYQIKPKALKNHNYLVENIQDLIHLEEENITIVNEIYAKTNNEYYKIVSELLVEDIKVHRKIIEFEKYYYDQVFNKKREVKTIPETYNLADSKLNELYGKLYKLEKNI